MFTTKLPQQWHVFPLCKALPQCKADTAAQIKILSIPDEFDVIALVIIGKRSEEINPELSEKQIQAEKQRPKRKKINEFLFHNKYGEKK